MNVLLLLLGFVLMVWSLVYLIVRLIKKNFIKKTFFALLGSGFILVIIAFAITEVPETGAQPASTKVNESEKKKEMTAEEKEAAEKKAAEEKAAAEAKEKAEAEKKAKEEAERKANAQSIPYPHLKKNPDRYSGEYVKYTGEIVQILEGNGMTNIRLSVTKDDYGYNIDDLIFVEYTGYTDFVDNDIVTIYGEVYGSYSYESQAGYNITLPGIIADEVTQ